MKVLYWTGLFWPHIGGQELFGMQLLPALKRRGFEFCIVTSHPDLNRYPIEQYQGIPLHRFPFQVTLMKKDMQQIVELRGRITALKKSFNPDLIHLNSGHPSLFFHHLTCHASAAPVLITIHNPPLGAQNGDMQYAHEDNALLPRLLDSADWVTSVSRAMLSDVRRLSPQISSRSSFIYNGLAAPDRPAAPLPFNPPKLLCIGRLVADKGFDIALEAFARLIKNSPDLRLIIAGDGPERGALEELSSRLDLTKAVEFAGWVQPEHVYRYINEATVVIVPSRWREPFGFVALQAAQMARPVVASDVGGLAEIISRGKTGLLVPKENSRELAEQISFLLENPDKAVRMGRAAQDRAGSVFGFSRFVDSYEELYRNLLRPEVHIQEGLK